jgi:hypothetical protein
VLLGYLVHNIVLAKIGIVLEKKNAPLYSGLRCPQPYVSIYILKLFIFFFFFWGGGGGRGVRLRKGNMKIQMKSFLPCRFFIGDREK